MDRRVRLGLWVACASLVLGGPAVVHPPDLGSWMLWKSSVVVLGLTGVLALLLTTPADAIRLPRWVSELVVIAGAVLVYEQLGGSRAADWAALAGVVAVGLLRLVPGGVTSPWWGCLAVWHPALRLGIDQVEFGVGRPEGAVTILGWLLVSAGALLVPVGHLRARRGARLVGLAVWVLGTAISLFIAIIKFR